MAEELKGKKEESEPMYGCFSEEKNSDAFFPRDLSKHFPTTETSVQSL